MCLYPKLIKNPKYKANKKNKGEIPTITDTRVLWVPKGCQNCIECRKQKSREWQTRLLEHIKTNTNGKYVTFTLSNESIKEITELKPTKTWKGLNHLTGYDLDNEIATHAIRLFMERYRAANKKTLPHWLITELGGNGTENIHIHGILWTNDKLTTIETIWKYGFMWKGKRTQKTDKRLINYVNEQTINYIVKYITKTDEKHKHYKSKILTSPGIGNNYTTTYNSTKNKFNQIPQQTNETYTTRTGNKTNMPIYWRNKMYTEEQREKLWLQKLNKQERWVMKQKISIKNGDENYWKALKHAQQINDELGYGNDKENWEQHQYEIQKRNIKIQHRIKNAK